MSSSTAIHTNKRPLSRVCIYTLTILALLYTAYLAQNLILLLLVAGLVSLLLSPGVKALEKIYVPRVLGATFLLALLVVPSTALIVQLEEPITKWAKLLPQLSQNVSEQISALNDVIETGGALNKSEPVKEESWFSWFDDEPPQKVEDNTDVIETQLKESLFSFATDFLVSAPFALVQFLTTLILILFTLVYSPKLFEKYVELFVDQSQQEKAYQLALNAQRQLSKYILTVSAINLCLSFAAIGLFTLLGLEDALLLGLIVGFVNFIPFVGPMFALGLIAIAGLVQWGTEINVIFVVGGVLVLNIIESQILTPLVLANNMRINPFIIILWLLVTAWFWGLVGILIAVPLLVCIKLLLSSFQGASSWIKFISS